MFTTKGPFYGEDGGSKDVKPNQDENAKIA
jgi:hypothetical protein